MGELCQKTEARSKKPEARSQKPEARSQKPEYGAPVQLVLFWLLASDKRQLALLASCF
jgi:hypothetical protein